ncbi:MAG: adenylate kinase [Candidatus Eisenbacteria bacterium]|nr:adenylate kinase [Candidatus Latescibacterota bacterium]MBD3301342.1 adenylate kinase [Candidatus Eisenbacteria bacterium]
MRIILLGAPGSGKGTQGDRIVGRYGIPRISTGDILRRQIAEGTELGREAQQYVDRGNLVPDPLILGMVRDRLQQGDVENGFLLDGFPRSIPQAEGFDALLLRQGKRLDLVVKLDVSKRLLIERMAGRRVCEKCGALYNVKSEPPRKEGVCDRCGGPLTQRDDDAEETVRQRLAVYEKSTAPLIDYYDAQELLVIVEAEGSVDEVDARIRAALDARTGREEGAG